MESDTKYKASSTYSYWRSGKSTSGYDWIDVVNFILIGTAELTDYDLSQVELIKIKEINETMFASWVGEGMPYVSDEPDKKLKVAFDWYNSVDDDAQIVAELRQGENWLKEQDWFSTLFATSIIQWLVEMVEAAGKVIDNEKGAINTLAQLFKLEKPYD